jgi:ribonuclease P protein component
VPDAGFSKKLRLSDAAEFKAVFSGAEYKLSNRNLLVLAIRNSFSYPRLGLVISKKNVHLSVDRNRIKRLLRTTFRMNQNLLAGLDIVILARNDLGALDNPGLRQAITRLWQDLAAKHGSRMSTAAAGSAQPLTKAPQP